MSRGTTPGLWNAAALFRQILKGSHSRRPWWEVMCMCVCVIEWVCVEGGGSSFPAWQRRCWRFSLNGSNFQTTFHPQWWSAFYWKRAAAWLSSRNKKNSIQTSDYPCSCSLFSSPYIISFLMFIRDSWTLLPFKFELHDGGSHCKYISEKMLLTPTCAKSEVPNTAANSVQSEGHYKS